ncbi:MAG: signal peptidase II [Halieaceae bacterium]|nr:signal peptidase II [Halieaceae bacterium]
MALGRRGALPDRGAASRPLRGRFTPPLMLWLSIAVVVVFLDQWSKGLAVSQLQYGAPVRILPVLNFTLQFNSGAAFSILSDLGDTGRWLLSALSILISVGLLVWMFSLPSGEWLLGFALAFILGGALGNLWDRLQLGHVVDFISVHYADRFFPTFNLADSAITLGVILMLADTLIQARQGSRA